MQMLFTKNRRFLVEKKMLDLAVGLIYHDPTFR